MTKLHGVDHSLITSCSCSVCEGVRRRLQSAPSRDFLNDNTATPITTDRDLAGSLATQFGFAPTESLCVVQLTDDGMMGMGVRASLSDALDQSNNIAAALIKNGVSNVYIMGVSDDEVAADLTAHEMASRLRETGFGVPHVAVVDNSAVTIPSAVVFDEVLRDGDLADYQTQEQMKASFEPVNNASFSLSHVERDTLIADLRPEDARQEAARWHEIAVQTGNPEAYVVAGWSYFLHGSGSKARAAFRKAEELHPGHALAVGFGEAIDRGVTPDELFQSIQRNIIQKGS